MIHCGDMFDIIPTLATDSIDACVTDPPYGIGFMGKEWDTFKPGEESKRISPNRAIESDNPNLRGRARSPASSPSSVAYDYSANGLRAFQAWTERWARQVFRVLKPGGYLLVCGAPRAYHRMACGVEDAGFEIRDCLAWLYGQGFPKSLDVGEGLGTALKPAHEPIVLARKPFKGSVKANVEQHGTGALNIDACRIVFASDADKAAAFPGGKVTSHGSGSLAGPGAAQDATRCEFEAERNDLGRWPANVALDEYAASTLDQQSGESASGVSTKEHDAYQGESITGFLRGRSSPRNQHGDVGGASRFYYVAKPSREERDYGCEELRHRSAGEVTDRTDGSAGLNNPRAGAGRTGGGRNFHPTVKPVELMRWLVRLVTPPTGVVLDPFTGSGTTGIACRLESREFIGIEREAEYVEIARRRIDATAPLLAVAEVLVETKVVPEAQQIDLWGAEENR